MLRPLLLPAAIAATAVPLPGGPALAQVTIHERIVIRVPRMPPPPPAAPIRWKEKDGPKCIAATDVTGAAVSKEGEVDLVLLGTKRVRAQLDEDCPALAFYSGFYLKPGPDGQLCAKRDSIRSRSGRACPIRHFRRLVPRKP